MAMLMKMMLNDICELIVDCEHKTAPIQETGYPSIRTPNVGRGRLILDGVNRVSEETYRRWSQRAVPQTDDIILAREAPLGNAAIIPPNLDVCLGQRTVLIRPNKNKVDPHYLVYLMLGDEIQGQFHGLGAGATVPHLNMKDIRELPLPKLPPLSVQQKIGAFLSVYDNLIENNTRRIKDLKQAAHDLYRVWFLEFRFLGHENLPLVDSGTDYGMIPQGWEVVKLEDVIELAYGKALKAEDRISGDVPVYGSSGIVGFHNEYLVEAPGVIVGRKGNVGSVFWSENNFYPIDTVYYVNTHVCLHYVYYNLQYQNFINNDAAVPGLSRRQAYALPFVVPSKDVLAEFQDFVAPIFEQIHVLNTKNDTLRETRDLLLPRLVSGELDVSKVELGGIRNV